MTGVRAGRTSSREMGMKFEGAHAVRRAEGNTGRAVMARTAPTPRGLRTEHVRKLFTRDAGDPAPDRVEMVIRSAP